jgi:hypothetical protein
VRLDVSGYALAGVTGLLLAGGWRTRRQWLPVLATWLLRFNMPSILGVALLLRCGVLLFCDLTQFSDYADFHNIAVQLLERGVWWDPGRPPGISWVAAGCYAVAGVQVVWPLLVNVLFGVASIYVVGRVGTLLFGREIGLAGALLLALYPEHILHANYLCSEPGYFLGIHVAIWCYVCGWERPRQAVMYWALAGLSVGVAHYFRSTTPLFFLAWGAVHLLAAAGGRQSLRRAAGSLSIAGAAFLLTIAPIIAHNCRDLGIVSISSYQMGGWSLYLSTNPVYLGNWNQADVDFFEGVYALHPAPPGAHPVVYRDRLALHFAKERFLDFPLHWAGAFFLFKPYCFWGDPSGSFWVNQQFAAGSGGQRAAGFWLIFWHKAVLLLAALALWGRGAKWAGVRSPLLFDFFVWFAGMSTVFFCITGTEGRYHNVHLGWLCLLAAFFLLRPPRSATT